MTNTAARSPDSQRADFKRNRYLAMPLAALLVWLLPLIVFGCYLLTIPALEARWRQANAGHG